MIERSRSLKFDRFGLLALGYWRDFLCRKSRSSLLAGVSWKAESGEERKRVFSLFVPIFKSVLRGRINDDIFISIASPSVEMLDQARPVTAKLIGRAFFYGVRNLCHRKLSHSMMMCLKDCFLPI